MVIPLFFLKKSKKYWKANTRAMKLVSIIQEKIINKLKKIEL